MRFLGSILPGIIFARLQVEWLKNDEPLRLDLIRKYDIVGNGTELKVHNIEYADTGAYMCQAANIGGLTRDISSLIVQQEPTPSACSLLQNLFL